MGGCYSAAGDHAAYYPKHKLPKENRSKPNSKLLKQESRSYSPDNSTDEVEDNQCSDGTLSGDRKHETKNSDSGIGSLGSSTDKDGPAFEEKLDEVCDRCQQKLLRDSRTSCEVCGEITFRKSTLFNHPPSSAAALSTYCSCGPRHAAWQRLKPTTCSTHINSPKTYRHSDIAGLKSSLKKLPNRQPHRQNHLSWKSTDSLDYVASMYTSMDHAKSEASDIFRDDVSFRAPLAAFDSVDDHLELSISDVYRAGSYRTNTQTEIQHLADSICRCEFSASDFVKSLENGPVVRKEAERPEVKCDNVTCSSVFPTESVCNNNKTDPSIHERNSNRHSAASVGDRSVHERNRNSRRVDVGDNSVHERHSKRSSVDAGDQCNGTVCGDSQGGNIVCNGIDGGRVELRRKPVKPASSRLSFSQSEAGLDIMCLPSRDDLETMVVDGREVVLVDVDVYDQVMTGLAQLRSHLSQLNTVIQESEDLEYPLTWAGSYIDQSWTEDCQDQ
ncbi:uncharacterized protein LOC121378707 [Gigantopelta aegis]|uniref:uncharacterized protein LOC121378707 n=1 Tax=Gigantopelta aegis TaxID=1735272 RepID=UPI001B88E22D|nr:uncharacterized protein LOC121378707 [Gigantopelta aegis]